MVFICVSLMIGDAEHLLGWLLPKRQEITSAGKDFEELRVAKGKRGEWKT